MKLYCDKCQSERVEQFSKEPPKEKRMSMREYLDSKPSQIQTNDLVMRYTTMVMLCKDCGNRYEYAL